MPFLVVEILNQRQLIKYAQNSDKWQFLEGVPLTWREYNILTYVFGHNHLLTKPNIYAKFEQNRWFELYHLLPGSAGFSHGHTLN